MEVLFKRNDGYIWEKNSRDHIKGLFWDRNKNILLENENVFNILSKINSIQDLKVWLEGVDGHFSICLKRDNKFIIVVDRLRTIPIFYSLKQKIISDNTLAFENNVKSYNKEREAEFISAGYVIGDYTMLENVFQVQAGEIVEIDEVINSRKKNDYFLYNYRKSSVKCEDLLLKKLDQVYLKTFKKLFQFIKDKTVVVPLSGGYDSRLIAHMLHRLNFKKVICFTYGVPNNWEVKISKKAAKSYGFKWLFVEYNKNDLKNLYENITDYFKYSVNHCSFGHTQDLLAVKKLHELNLVPIDSIFIPGHSGDFVAGSHIPARWKNLSVNDYIFDKHCSLWNNPFKQNIKEKIEKQISCFKSKANQIEFWDWRERQAKYICNSVRVYEFYGYKWLLPLWSKDIMEFWLSVPVRLKISRRIYFKYAKLLHGNLPANPKQSRLANYYNRISDLWYSRFFGDTHYTIFFFKTIDKVFNSSLLPNFINPKERILSCIKAALNTLKMWIVIKY